MNKKGFLLIVTFFILCSCKESQKKQTERILNEWQGKEIIIPPAVTFKHFGKDTLCNYLWDKPYKIFVYVDSVGCSSCQLGLQAWKGIVQNHSRKIDLGFIFVVHSSNFNRLDTDVLILDFDYPIIYDYNNYFDKLNNFPPAPFRTFLLDKDNKVLLIGSPIGNIEMWEKYKSVMASVRNE